MDDMLLLTEVRPLGGDPAATDIFEVLDNKDQQYLGLRMADNFNDQKRLNHLGKALEWGQQFICERLTGEGTPSVGHEHTVVGSGRLTLGVLQHDPQLFVGLYQQQQR